MLFVTLDFGAPHARETVLAALSGLKAGDVDWRAGRAFSLAYSAGEDVLGLSEEAYRLFSGDNALNTAAFPSLRQMQADVVAVARGWVSGDQEVAGFMTSGGTESLLLAVRAALQRAKRTGDGHPRGPSGARWNMVLPMSAHAALEKASDYFGVESRRVNVGPDWRADVRGMSDSIDENTILVVASAPQYPQGVIDPVVDIAALASERGASCHVDACMGGVVLPYLERLGHRVPPWDFRVPGVTSVSVDLHKYGYTAKGAGVLLHRTRELRDDQVFVTDRWLGGLYGSSGILGTKSGGPIASAWAVMHYLGDVGYERLASRARVSTERIAEHVRSHESLRLLADPDSTLIAVTSDTIDPHAVAVNLRKVGWYVDSQGPPASLHLTVNAVHDQIVEGFLEALDAAADGARGAPAGNAAYGTVD